VLSLAVYPFHRECVEPSATYSYHGLVHRAGRSFNEADFIETRTRFVDFKYFGVAEDHLVVRPSSERLSDARDMKTTAGHGRWALCDAALL